MKLKEILITPELAKLYLSLNNHNRDIKAPVVARYSQDIANGKWKTGTAESIKIASDGTVLDGQHRLHAIIKANTDVLMLVAEGLDRSVFDVIDTGSVRNASDVFKVAMVERSNRVPSTISKWYNLKNSNRFGSQKNLKLTNSELLHEYKSNPLEWDNITKHSINLYSAFAKILSPSTIGGFYAYFKEISETEAHSFMQELCTGINITNNTIALLRQKLMQDKMSLRKMPVDLKDAFIIKTWNAYRQKTEHKILKFSPDNESFPIAI